MDESFQRDTHSEHPFVSRSLLLSLGLIIGLTLIFFWKILLTNLILVGTDTFLYFYPYKAYASEALRAGRIPLWNPHLFMGAPLLANSQVGVFYPLNWPLLWLSAPKQVAWSIGLHITLAGIFMMMFTRFALRLSWLACLTAAIVFAFGGYLGAQVEHINQLNGAVWLPLLFLLYDLGLPTFNNKLTIKHGVWFLLMMVVVAIILLAGHAQTAFISLFGVGLYGLARFGESIKQQINEAPPPLTEGKQPWRLNRSLIRLFAYSLLWHLLPLGIVSLGAIMVAAIQLLPTVELSGLSIRQGGLTFQEVVSFSTKPTTLHYTILPPYGVDLSQIMGQTFSEWVAYIGITGLMLAGLGLCCAIQKPLVWRFVFVGASGLLLSFGLFLGPLYLFDIYIGLDSRLFHIMARATHPYYLLYYFVPGFDLFRVPARWLLLYGFGSAILAGFGMDALKQPSLLQQQLRHIQQWLTYHNWRLTLLVGLPILSLVSLILWQRPPLITLIAWLLITLINLGLLAYLLQKQSSATTAYPLSLTPLLLLLISELFFASQTLNYNEPTAPQAYHSMRNAVAYLQSVKQPDGVSARFLSLSGTVYDPGDLADMQQIFGEALSPKAMTQLLVASKQKEVLSFNLPMVYGLNSVDGYDGGILPLTKFVTLQALFLPEDNRSIDGRLREKLRYVPDNRLLSMLNTRWIITDKVFDAWIDGIFYDLQFPAYLKPDEQLITQEIPDFPATAIGFVSHLQDASMLINNTTIAQVQLTFADDSQEDFLLHAGIDTAEGQYDTLVAHTETTVGVGWPYGEAGQSYITVHPINSHHPLVEIKVTAQQPQGTFVLRGVSLIHEPTTTSRSLILSTEGDYQRVHSGDVKIYENRAVLPRAYIVPLMEQVTSNEEAIARLTDPSFDPSQTFVTVQETLPINDSQNNTLASEHLEGLNKATVIDYQAERVEITTTVETPGWLILTDTDYPGWQATIYPGWQSNQSGQVADIIPANLMFRAVKLPVGKQTVLFEFKPHSYTRGWWVSGISLMLIISLMAGLGIKWQVSNSKRD